MSLNDWPKQERPREKLLARDVSILSDAELLAILIGSGARGRSAVAVARELLKEFGSLRAISSASRTILCRHAGLGDAFYSRLQVASEISRRILFQSLKKKDAMVNSDSTKNFLSLQMRNYKREVFACLFLDNQHQVISFEELFHGTINSANVYPRELVKRALHHNAAAVIFVHNHPSGSSEPSSADRYLTDDLKKILESIDIRVLDHFVVGETVTSFAELDML